MPYSNVPAHLTGKMDDCVRKLQAQGHTKESAIRICYDSVVGKAMTTSARKAKRDEKRQRAAERRLSDLQHKAQLATAAMADLAAEIVEPEPETTPGRSRPGIASQAVWPETKADYPWDECMRDQMKRYGDKETAKKVCGKIRAGKSLEEAEAELGVKCMDESYMPWMPYGGATSLADAMAAMDAAERAGAINRATWLFQDVTGNILRDETIADKGKAIAAAAKELQALLNDPEPLMKSGGEAPSEPPEAKTDQWVPSEPSPVAQPEATAGETQESVWEKFLSFVGLRKAASAGQGQALRSDSPSGLRVFKQADGGYRWFGWVSNKFRDRDTAKHPAGEIITEAAHKEFVTHLDAHPAQAPELWSWHTPGTARQARADWWDYADGYLLMSGPLTEAEAKGYEDTSDAGMSHGFYVLARDGEQGLIEQYRTFEASDLPVVQAANPFTAFDVIRKELAMGFSKDKRDYLVKRLGEEKVAELEKDTAAMSKALEALGVESKTAAPEAKQTNDCMKTHMDKGMSEAEAKKACADEASGGKALETAAPDPAQHILDDVVKALNLPELQAGIAALKAQADRVPELEKQLVALGEQLKALAKSDDQKVADAIAPKIKPISWGFQASASEKTVLSDADKARLKGPAGENNAKSWIGEAFGDLVK